MTAVPDMPEDVGREELPPGFYAVHILDEDGTEDIGWHLVERTKRGRTTWHAVPAPGVSPERLAEVLAWELDYFGGDHMGNAVRWAADMPDYYAEVYGKLTGRCGVCGRKLTDPASVMRGIGPECATAHRRHGAGSG